jgi:hypothetical protein
MAFFSAQVRQQDSRRYGSKTAGTGKCTEERTDETHSAQEKQKQLQNFSKFALLFLPQKLYRQLYHANLAQL